MRGARQFGINIALCLMLAFCSLSHGAATPAWKPERNVEIMIPSAAGGGFDRTGRAIQKIWQTGKAVDVTISVLNKPGGGGAVGWAYLAQQTGSGHHLGLCSPTLLTNQITGANNLGHTDFTPIAQLFSEYLGFAVRTDSPIRDAKDLLTRLSSSPGSLSIAIGTAPGGPNHIGVALVMRGARADVRKQKIVFFKNAAESSTALLGGHVDVMATSISNFDNMLEAKQIRLLAIAAPGRQPGPFAGIPTWKELGVEGVFANWRCVIGPKGMSPAQVAYWDEQFARLVATREWKAELEENAWDNNYLRSSATRRFFETEYDIARRTLADLGLAK